MLEEKMIDLRAKEDMQVKSTPSTFSLTDSIRKLSVKRKFI